MTPRSPFSPRACSRFAVTATLALLACAGCKSARADAKSARADAKSVALRATTQSATGPTTLPAGLAWLDRAADLHALAPAPVGWREDRTSHDARHEHVTWVSPEGGTAYGIIFFRMPLPAGANLAFNIGFLPTMRREDGYAIVHEKAWDDAERGLRIKVEGKTYTVRSLFRTRGLRGWSVYAGTLNGKPLEPANLKLAEQAREATEIEK